MCYNSKGRSKDSTIEGAEMLSRKTTIKNKIINVLFATRADMEL